MIAYLLLALACGVWLGYAIGRREGFESGRWEIFERLPKIIQNWIDDTYASEDPFLLRRQFAEDDEVWLR